MAQNCDLCSKSFSGRNFQRRGFREHTFCSVTCVEAFEVRASLPNGRVYESRPGWSRFPVVQPQDAALPC